MFVALSISATTITATVETKTKASLTCDDPLLMQQLTVTYSNSGPNATQVTKGSTAILTMDGLPKGEVHGVTLWMKSNSSAGAASISIQIGEYTWNLQPSPYKDWPGVSSYSTTPQAIPCVQETIAVARSSRIQVQIDGTINSVYLSQVEVDYTEAPKEPHTVTLHWMDANMNPQTSQLIEDSAGMGIRLPSPDADPIWHNDMHWYGIGWCEQSCETTDTEPVHWEADDWYLPLEDCSLYALYTNSKGQVLTQDSSGISGEYVMVRRNNSEAWMLFGVWNKDRISTQSVSMTPIDSGLYQLDTDAINDTCRYTLTFTPDSVEIQHSISAFKIGYGKNMHAYSTCKWAWKKMKDGTFFIHNTWKETIVNSLSYFSGKALCINRDEKTEEGYISYEAEAYFDNYSYWYLFPMKDIPLQQDTYFTTFAVSSAMHNTEKSTLPRSAHLQRTIDGKVVIINNQQTFDLLGRPIL